MGWVVFKAKSHEMYEILSILWMHTVVVVELPLRQFLYTLACQFRVVV